MNPPVYYWSRNGQHQWHFPTAVAPEMQTRMLIMVRVYAPDPDTATCHTLGSLVTDLPRKVRYRGKHPHLFWLTCEVNGGVLCWCG